MYLSAAKLNTGCAACCWCGWVFSRKLSALVYGCFLGCAVSFARRPCMAAVLFYLNHRAKRPGTWCAARSGYVLECCKVECSAAGGAFTGCCGRPVQVVREGCGFARFWSCSSVKEAVIGNHCAQSPASVCVASPPGYAVGHWKVKYSLRSAQQVWWSLH